MSPSRAASGPSPGGTAIEGDRGSTPRPEEPAARASRRTLAEAPGEKGPLVLSSVILPFRLERQTLDGASIYVLDGGGGGADGSYCNRHHAAPC